MERNVGSGRNVAIDVLRGLALSAMVASHTTTFAGRTLIERVSNLPRWIDGAFVFVPVSGLVTGLVHRRVVERRGLAASRRKLVRRAAFIYVVHIALTIMILVTASWRRVTGFGVVPTWTEVGGVARGLFDILRLHLQLDFNDVLPMYVAFLLWAVVAVTLLRRGRWSLVAGISLVVYVFAQTVTGLALKPGGFQIGSWQLLFTAGLVAGWRWEHERLDVPGAWRRGLVHGSVGIWAVMLAAGRLAPVRMVEVFGRALAKMSGGWLAFLYAGVAIVVGYVAIERASRVPLVGRLLWPVKILGSKGLPGFATMVVASLVLDLTPSIPRNDAVIVAVLVLCGLAEYAALRWGFRRVRTHQRPRNVTTVSVPASPWPAPSKPAPPDPGGGRLEQGADCLALGSF